MCLLNIQSLQVNVDTEATIRNLGVVSEYITLTLEQIIYRAARDDI